MVIYIYTYIRIYRFVVNSTKLYVGKSILGTKARVGQKIVGRKPGHCAGYVTDLGTWREI